MAKAAKKSFDAEKEIKALKKENVNLQKQIDDINNRLKKYAAI